MPTRNGLLSRLPEPELDRIMAIGHHRHAAAREAIVARHEPIREIIFPLTGMVSILTSDATGAAVEVYSIGREGAMGVSALFGHATTPFDAVWQLPGEAIFVPLRDLRAIAPSVPSLAFVAARYQGSLVVQTGQNGACNRLHHMAQRSAKWLLLSHDRVDGDVLELTQEFFARMLGVTRPKLSEVESELRGAGLIGSRDRGKLRILDRSGLERLTCECYWIIREELSGMLPSDPMAVPQVTS